MPFFLFPGGKFAFLIKSRSLIRAEKIRYARKWDKLGGKKKKPYLNKLLAGYGSSLNLSLKLNSRNKEGLGMLYSEAAKKKKAILT